MFRKILISLILIANLYFPARSYTSVILQASSTEYLNLGSAICTSYPFSISAWFKVPDVDNNYSIVWIGDTGTSNNSLGGVLSNGLQTNSMALHVRDSTTNEIHAFGAVTINTWMHILAVFHSTTSREVCPNGGTCDQSTASVSPIGTDETTIGSVISVPTWYYEGNIAEVAIWCDDALTESDGANLSNGANPQTIPGLNAYWPLLNDANDIVGSNDMTLNGAGITFDSGDHPTVNGYGGFGTWLLLGR